MKKPMYKNESWLGKTIGKYTITGFGGKEKYKSQTVEMWKVKCECGTEKKLSKWHLIYGHVSGCSDCVGDRIRFSDCKNWNSEAKNVTGMYYGKIKAAAEKRKIPFNITREEMDDVFQSQNGKCKYLGLPLYFETHGIKGNASLDRIDSSKGYTKQNIQWVHKDVNTIKWDLSHEAFIGICKTIAENFNGKQ
jgi:hypothetical protein